MRSILIDTAILVVTSDATVNPILPDHRPILWPVLGKPMIIQAIDPLYRLGVRHFNVLIGIEDTIALSELQRRWMPDVTIDVSMVMPGEKLQQAIQRVYASGQQGEGAAITIGHNVFFDEATLAAVVSGTGTELVIGEDHNPVTCGRLLDHQIAKLAQEQAKLPLNKMLAALAEDTNVSYHTAQWHIQVDTLADLYHLHYQLQDIEGDPYILSDISDTVKIIPPVRIDPQVSIGQGSTIGPYVYLERGTRVGYRAHIDHALILDRGTVDANESISRVVVSKNGRYNVS